jgi:DNA-binding XRE family transcriptional regulator
MEPNIVRELRTCQPLATCETTFRESYVPIGDMEDDQDIIARLIAIRTREGMSQSEFAEALGLSKTIYNPFERGKRPLTLDAARRIRRRFGYSVDWLLFGDIGQPNETVARELGPQPGKAPKVRDRKIVGR